MFSVGRRDGFVTLAKHENILTLGIHLDARTEDAAIALELAADMGLMHPNNQVLIDLTTYIGTVDWTIVRDLRRFAPWVDQGGTACAYLLHNTQLSWLVQIVTAFYPRVRHRIFRDKSDALNWLHEFATRTRPDSNIRAGDAA